MLNSACKKLLPTRTKFYLKTVLRYHMMS